ncbi:acyltransferase family protein [Dinghuibacter silviterrae]|uniref:Putative membrane protein YcfT n=1 Tax=Dinghuibacter silviterrae TaxID=1539049 RepID=A0A4R8DU70_9BACT|nr:acyltransferase [Dinghuibacter silviterrae]TDX01900.1 putative membrane protein YcfT [Dinghuibacter silviterrae]
MKAPAWLSKGLNLPALQRSRLHWVDYLKGIAIILVVYRHILIGMTRSNAFTIPRYLYNANEIFFSFRMPLFFILSGIFLGGSLAKRTPGQLLLQKFENLFYPYLVWATIQITLQILMGHFHLINADRTWRDYLYIFYQPESLDQFWYLPALFNTTMIYLFTKAKLKLPGWSQLLLGLGLYWVYYYTPGIDRYSMLSDWLRFYIFFALGDVLAKEFFKPSFQKVLSSPWSLLAVTPVFVLSQVYYLSHHVSPPLFLGIALTGCVTMTILAFLLQRYNVANWLRIFGYHSLYIYVIHVMVAAVVRNITLHVFHIHQVHVVLLTGIFFGITIPVFFYNYLVKDGPLWFLFYFRKSSMHDREKRPAPKTMPSETPQHA